MASATISSCSMPALPTDLPSPDDLRRLSDRRTGIGFDQALVLEPPRRAGTDVYYRIFNADGSEVEQCGNGARCIARLVASRRGEVDRPLQMDSPGGIVQARLRPDGLVSVAMGVPNFDPASLPFDAPSAAATYHLDTRAGPVEIGAVSIGNPHAVIRVRDVQASSRGQRRTRSGKSPSLSAPGERGFPRDRCARPCAAARVRAGRRRNPGMWHGCLRCGRHRPAARAAGRGSERGCPWRTNDRPLARPGRADLADRSGRNGFRRPG